MMPQRVADDIEEIARPNRGDQQEKPQIHADPALRRPRLIQQTPGVGGGGDRPCRRGGRGLGGFLGIGLSGGVGAPRPVDLRGAARPGSRPPRLFGNHCRWFCSRGRSGPHRTLQAHSAHLGYHPRRPVAPHGFRCSDRSPQRSFIGVGLAALATWYHQRCGLHTRRPSRRCRRGQGRAARDRGAR